MYSKLADNSWMENWNAPFDVIYLFVEKFPLINWTNNLNESVTDWVISGGPIAFEKLHVAFENARFVKIARNTKHLVEGFVTSEVCDKLEIEFLQIR